MRVWGKYQNNVGNVMGVVKRWQKQGSHHLREMLVDVLCWALESRLDVRAVPYGSCAPPLLETAVARAAPRRRLLVSAPRCLWRPPLRRSHATSALASGPSALKTAGKLLGNSQSGRRSSLSVDGPYRIVSMKKNSTLLCKGVVVVNNQT